MKTGIRIAAALPLLLLTSSCGWYTNVPAQLHIVSVTPSAITVTYKAAAANSGAAYEADVADALLTVAGSPGSIGATFTTATVEYLDSGSLDSSANLKSAQGINKQFLDIAMRVTPSDLRSDSNTAVDDPNWKTNKLVIGTGQFSLGTAVDRDVLDYGFKKGSNSLVAKVTLDGTDDAKFHVQLSTSVPIVFRGLSQ